MMPLKPFFAYRSFRRELETVRRFYETGVRQFCVFPANTTNSLGQPYVEYPPNWIFFDTYEFEHVDRQIADLLSAAPEAELLCMIDLNSPNWLVRQLMQTAWIDQCADDRTVEGGDGEVSACADCSYRDRLAAPRPRLHPRLRHDRRMDGLFQGL